MTKLIGIMGKKGSGKDTAADYLVKNYCYKKTAFAEPVKKIAQILFGFSEQQLYTEEKEKIDPYWGVSPREVFQKIGTDFGQYDLPQYFPVLRDRIGRNIWSEMVRSQYEKNPINTVICDVRFIHEVNMIRNAGGIIIKINRNIGNEDHHISENEMEQIENDKIDYIVNNDKTKEDLYKTLDKVLSELNDVKNMNTCDYDYPTDVCSEFETPGTVADWEVSESSNTSY